MTLPFTVVNVHYLSTMQTTSLGASVIQTTLPSPTTELINRVDDDATTTAITTPVTDRVTVGGDKGDTHVQHLTRQCVGSSSQIMHIMMHTYKL